MLNKKIYLIRSNTTKFGGAENYLCRLSKALVRKNIDHKIVNSFFPLFLPSWLRVILFNLQICLMKGDKFYFSLDRITCPDLYRAGDGVHKVFLSIEDKSKLNLLHPIYLYLEQQCFNNAKYIIANSNMVKEQIIDTYNINPKKINVIYNGIELTKFDYKISFNKLSKKYLISKNKSILLFVGSGFKRKGVAEFLQIISKLKTKDIMAFVIGKEKSIKYYKRLSKNLNIDKKVIFTGPRQDVEDFYTISDIFLFPTRYDPFSNVVLEAMSFENAVFTTKQNGAHEVLKEEYIMSNSKDFSVVKKIDQLLNNTQELDNIKTANQLMADQLSIDLNMKKTIEVINMI